MPQVELLQVKALAFPQFQDTDISIINNKSEKYTYIHAEIRNTHSYLSNTRTQEVTLSGY